MTTFSPTAVESTDRFACETRSTAMKTALRVTLGLALAAMGALCLLATASDFDLIVALIGVQLMIAGVLVAANRVPAGAARFTAPEQPVVNPATGRLMVGGVGGVDTAGNPFGVRRDH